MCGCQTIISHRSGCSQAGVDDRRPTFQAMVMVAMKNIREANGGNGCGGFYGSESGVVVHNVVGEQRFIAAATAKIQSGEVIESAGGGNGGEEQVVFAIPERILERWRFWLTIRVLRAGWLLRGIEGRANDQ